VLSQILKNQYTQTKGKNTKEKLKALRKKHGMTQEELAKKIGVSLSAVRHYENGRNLPSKKTMEKICEIFKTTPEELGGTAPAQKTGTDTKGAKKKDTDKNTCSCNVKIMVESEDGKQANLCDILDVIPEGTSELYLKPSEDKAYFVTEDSAGYIVLW